MKGICTISNIPLRKEADSRSEILSMVLFGETYGILEEGDGWIKIITDTDSYEGWIGGRQFTRLEAIPASSGIVTSFPFVILESITGNIMAPSGSLLPDYQADHTCRINEVIYKVQEVQFPVPSGQLLSFAQQFLNSPYLWGGRTAFGIDCSGFTQTVYKCCGVQIRRDAWQQAEMGVTVHTPAEVKPGDLAFFDNDQGRITHVGIMIDAETIIHASGKVRIDGVDEKGIFYHEQEKVYSHKLSVIKRMLN